MIKRGHTLDPDRACEHLDRVYRAALGLTGSRHEAEDLVQETYLLVLRKPRWVRDGDDLAYLIAVLRNTFRSNGRKAACRPRLADAEHDLDSFIQVRSASPQLAAESREVLAAVAALPEAFRDAVVAVDIAGLTCREAAISLGVAEGTVMSRLFRARRKLAAALEPEEALALAA